VHDAREEAGPVRAPESRTGLSTPAIPWRVATSPRRVSVPTMDWTWWAARISDLRNRFSAATAAGVRLLEEVLHLLGLQRLHDVVEWRRSDRLDRGVRGGYPE